MQPLLAVDAPSMLFRAFYALPSSIKGQDGQPVNALLGAANLILREVETHEPRAVVLCFGPDAAHYRVELFAGYHADREELPEELAPQWDDSRDFFEAFGWTVVSHESLEADDLLGTYARLEAEAGGGGPPGLATADRAHDRTSSSTVTWTASTSTSHIRASASATDSCTAPATFGRTRPYATAT